MAADLLAYRDGKPIAARRASPLNRAQRFVRRHALAVGTGSAVAVALIAASIVSWVQMQRAERAAESARHEARIATAVQNFMTDLFRSNTLDQRFDKRVRDMTAPELLDRGALAIESSLGDAPAAKASLLQLFGEMYEQLGLADRSIKMHEKSVEAAAAVYGDKSREFALALLEKAWVANLLDKNTDAPLKMVEPAKRVLAAVAPGSEDYAEALYMEAHTVIETDIARALAAAEESVRIMDRLGATAKRGAFARQELAYVYRRQGRVADAARMITDSIAGCERLYGRDSNDVASGRVGLALVLWNDLRLGLAEDQLRKAIEIQDKYPFLKTQSAAFYRLQLGQLMAQRGRYADALREIDTVEAVRSAAKDAFALTPPQVQGVRAFTRLTQGDYERGLAELEAAATDPAAFPRRSMISASVLQEFFARAYLLGGDVPRARAAVDKAREIAAKDGTTPIRSLFIALRDAETSAGEGRAAAALEALDAAVQKHTAPARNAEAQVQVAP